MLTVLTIIVFMAGAMLLLAAVAARQILTFQPETQWRDCAVQPESVVTLAYSGTQSSDDLDIEADAAMLRGDVARARLLRDLAEAQRVRDELNRQELRWQREHPPVRVRQHGVRGLEA